MKVLDLVLTYHWYDMISSGVKKEEYREIKKFYLRRLCDKYAKVIDSTTVYDFKHFDAIRFHRGYTKTSMLVECKGIGTGIGKPEWGASKDVVFIISLGNILE